MTWLAFVIITLAAARVTRLVTTDSITEPLRERLTRWPLAYELVTCPWCIGFWISLAWVAVWWTADGRAVWLAAPFAVSYLVGWTEQRS